MTMNLSRIRITVIMMGIMLLLPACATVTKVPQPGAPLAYIANNNETLSARYAPIVIPENSHRQYNKIGKPSARLNKNGSEIISINPSKPVYYVQKRTFTANDSVYTNLIYRIHFQKVPFSLIPFNLTTGNNVGLMIVITLNETGKPLLITTVHTCGCYLSIIPTSYLAHEAYPNNWDINKNNIHGIELPGRLEYPDVFAESIRPVIFLQDQTHRVTNINISSINTIVEAHQPMTAEIMPMNALKELPLNGGSTSFYKSSGLGKGYVKNSFKPFELLLMSWWVLDLYVGVDKEYGDRNETGTVFYTSLKPWNRKKSDMWNFEKFLEFWGWKL